MHNITSLIKTDIQSFTSDTVAILEQLMKVDMTSIGTGNTTVLLFSAEILPRVWRYLN